MMIRKSSATTKAVVYVRLKEGVLDPQGLTIRRALRDMGYEGIKEVKTGKFFEISLTCENRKQSQEKVDQICRKLLTNPIIERYSFKLEK